MTDSTKVDPTEGASSAGAPLHPVGRLRSLDALRGFDMVMLLGGMYVLVAVSKALGWTQVAEVLEHQAEHPLWNGFTAWDLVFPLFLFLAGVSLPLSLAKQRAAGATNGALVRRALKRAALLVFFGLVYNGLFGFEFERFRYASVLARIGLAWLGAALLWIYLPLRAVAIAGAVLLALHSCALLFVPAPDLELASASLEQGKTFSCWFDRVMVPGRMHRVTSDPEGLFGVISAVGTALLGAFAGHWITSVQHSRSRRIGGIILFGSQCLVAGAVLDYFGLPINKNLWTASFTLWAGGFSLLLLAFFHWIFDVVRADRVALAFTVVGANSILAYVASAFIRWQDVVDVLFARGLSNGRLHAVMAPVLALLLQWLILWALYRRRIFLRV